MKVLDIPKSGRDRRWVYYMRGRKLCRRKYVIPMDPRTPGQLRARAALATLAVDPSKRDTMMPILAEILKNRSPAAASARGIIANSVKLMGPDSKRFAPMLVEAMRRADSSDRFTYWSALQGIDPSALNIKGD